MNWSSRRWTIFLLSLAIALASAVYIPEGYVLTLPWAEDVAALTIYKPKAFVWVLFPLLFFFGVFIDKMTEDFVGRKKR